jgi:hypothetical protein
MALQRLEERRRHIGIDGRGSEPVISKKTLAINPGYTSASKHACTRPKAVRLGRAVWHTISACVRGWAASAWNASWRCGTVAPSAAMAGAGPASTRAGSSAWRRATSGRMLAPLAVVQESPCASLRLWSIVVRRRQWEHSVPTEPPERLGGPPRSPALERPGCWSASAVRPSADRTPGAMAPACWPA